MLSQSLSDLSSGPKRIVLISCVKTKLAVPAPAEALYTSPLFKFSLAYARRLAPDAIYILSAKHGLVALDQQIAPYEQTLKKMKRAQRAEWGQKVLRELGDVSSLATDHFTILAGRHYYDSLISRLPNHALPLDGLGQGKRLQFLKRSLAETSTRSEGLPAPAQSSASGGEPKRSAWRRFLDAF